MSLLDDVGGVFAGLGDLAAPATLTRTVPGAYDPVTGTNGAPTVTNCATSAVLDSSSLKTLGFVFGDGLVQGGDIGAMIPAKGLTFDPAPGDTLTVLGWAYVVIAVQPTFAGAVPVFHKLLVRK